MTKYRRHSLSIRTLGFGVLSSIVLLSSHALAGPYDPPANYYNSATGTGSTLKSQLHNIIDNHTFFSYNAARSILQVTDEDPSDSDRMLLVYDRVSLDVSAINPGGSIPGWDSGSSWNREHTWPRSRGIGSSGDDNSDLHQLRPSDPQVNSNRGNLNFGGAFGQSFGEISESGNDYWYPGDADAGMIARQQFYVATRYDGSDSSTEDLELVSGNPSTNDRFLGNLDRLVEWHYEAVPDDFELRRNDIIYDNYQGNRIPYVDRPEFVWSVFKDQQNDSQLYVGGSPASDGSSTLDLDFGSVIVGGSAPSGTQNVTLNKNGNDGTYYEITASGDATSSVTGRYNAFAINGSGTDSRSLTVGLDNVSTASAGAQSGSVVIDNLDVTTSGGTGRGANDGNDTINLNFEVLDHATPSWTSTTSSASLMVDFGTVTLGSTVPTIDFDVFNLESTAGFTADLELDAIIPFGDSGVLTTDLTTFTGGSALSPGLNNDYNAMFDASVAGNYAATYVLQFSDEDLSGANSIVALSLQLFGVVEAPNFLEADFNEDTFVDHLDLAQWEGDYGLNDESDANGDGVTDGMDFLMWQEQRGQSAPLVAAVATVPEPASALLMLVGLCVWGRRRA